MPKRLTKWATNIIKNDMIQNLTEAVLSWEKSAGRESRASLVEQVTQKVIEIVEKAMEQPWEDGIKPRRYTKHKKISCILENRENYTRN